MTDKTLDQLEAERASMMDDMLALDAELNELKEQIGRASQHFIETGQYADGDWFREATNKKRILSRQRQAMQFDLGLVGREIKKIVQARFEEKNKEWTQAFVTVARSTLDAATFEKIKQGADEMAKPRFNPARR